MTRDKHPKPSWDLLLSATPDELEELTSLTDDELPTYEELAREEALALALLCPKEQEVHEASSLFAWLQDLWRLRGPLLMPVTLFCLVFVSVVQQKPQQDTLICKGGPAKCAPVAKKNGISLQLGLLDSRAKKVRRVGHNGVYFRRQYLLFGFQLHHKQGFVYLFVARSDNKVELLFSPKSQGGKPWHKGFHELRVKGVLQQLPLDKEKGRLEVAIASVSSPLSSQELRALQRSAKGFLKALQARSRQGTFAFDLVVLRMGAHP